MIILGRRRSRRRRRRVRIEVKVQVEVEEEVVGEEGAGDFVNVGAVSLT